MKVVCHKQFTGEYVCTDAKEACEYQRIDAENWMVAVGNSWEATSSQWTRELELAYQEFLRLGDVSLVLYGRVEPYKPGDVEGLGWTPHRGNGDTHVITLTQEDLKRLMKPIEPSPPRS
jgi:hypothetical protein